MKKKKLLLIALLLVGAASSFAAKVDTLLVKSPSMNKDIKVVVVTPDAALGKKATACPTVYLLHGFGGHAKTWIEIKPNLPQIADEKGIIFVCPDGIVRCGDGRRQRGRNKIRIFPGFLRIYLFCLLQTANYRRKKLV